MLPLILLAVLANWRLVCCTATAPCPLETAIKRRAPAVALSCHKAACLWWVQPVSCRSCKNPVLAGSQAFLLHASSLVR